MFYKYNTITGKYEGIVDSARYDVTTGKLIDGFTELNPPKVTSGNELFFENGKWVLKPIDYQLLFEKAKQEKINEVKMKFLDKINNGIMHSDTLNKDINARKNIDPDNVKGLIDLMTDKGEQKTQFRCADNTFVEVTLDQLKAIKIEMIEYGFNLYQKKWQFESQIEQATTQEELDNIEVSF